MKQLKKKTRRRSFSRLVVDRVQYTKDYDRVILECGHDILVNYEQPHHSCPYCQMERYKALEHKFNWCLQTPRGYVLTVDKMFKPIDCVDRTQVRRFIERRVAEKYAKTLRLSVGLIAANWNTIMEDQAVWTKTTKSNH